MAAGGELREDGTAGEVDELVDLVAAAKPGTGANEPMPPVFGPWSPSSARLKSCAVGSADAETPSQSANTDTSGPSSSSSITSGPASPSSSCEPGLDLRLRRADDDTLAGGQPVGLEHARSRRPPGASPPSGRLQQPSRPWRTSSIPRSPLPPARDRTPGCRPIASTSASPATRGTSGPTTTRSTWSARASPSTASSVVGADGVALPECGDARISRRGVQLGQQW